MELLDTQLLLLREFELRLLRCTLPCDSSNQDTGLQGLHINAIASSDHHPLLKVIADVISLLESGLYAEALSSEAARLVFKLNSDELCDDSVDSADDVYSHLMAGVDSFFHQSSDATDESYRALLVMSIAIAAFLAFTQSNLTGPVVSFPDCPLPLKVSKGAEWENWARNQVMLSGSDLLGKFSNLQYIVFSNMLLMRAKDLLLAGPIASFGGIKTISWWLARVIFIQQRILDERSSSLFELLQVFLKESLNHFGTVKEVTSYWGPKLHKEEAATIATMLHLEAGVVEQTYGRVDSCWCHLQLAEVSSGLRLSVTGALGVRTMHQVEPKAQLVLVINTDKSNGVDSFSGISVIQNDASSNGNECLPPCEPEMSETSDILMIPKLLQKFDDHGIRGEHPGNRDNATALNASQQAVILAQCLLIEKSNRLDEMQRWKMAPYIEAIDSQKSSLFIIRCFCDILRIRWESTRSRTKERSLTMMERVVQSVYVPSPGVTERIQLCYGTLIPPTPELRKEYGNLLVGYGLIGEAVKIFEDLELWDNLIHCYCLLEKKAAAVELINTRLNQKPLDPRLWCSLGDITIDDSCYEKALEVSNNRSARAMRSLARSAYNRGEYEKSKTLWESAMAMNSLYPDGWFAFGAAALKARDVDKAVDGFTRAVQLDPENGEAWNNIACLHMIKKKNKEASIAFKEALKFKRNSWQLWENYGQVSLEVGNLSQALEAVQMVLDLTNKKRIDVTSLETIMLQTEKRFSANKSAHRNDSGDMIDSVTVSAPPDQGIQSSRENDNLLESLGKTLQMIVRSGSPEAAIWGLYAKWHKIKGDLTMCSEALLKQVRSYQGSDMWKDTDRFKKFARASLDLCKVYMEIASSTHNRRELVAAEMHLKNIIKQGESFSDVEEFRDLQACLTEVKNLQSSMLSSSIQYGPI